MGSMSEVARNRTFRRFYRPVLASHNMPLPEFTSESGYFVARLRKQIAIGTRPHYDELNERQRGILRHIRDAGRITIKDYVKQYHISERQALNDINELIQFGFIQRLGVGRSTYYELAPFLKEPVIKWD